MMAIGCNGQPARRPQAGFTLLEVLVALLIISVGVLGIASMVLHSMRASVESNQHTMAALMALDMSERAWLEAAADPDLDCDLNDLLGDDGQHPYLANTWLPGVTATVGEADSGAFTICRLTLTWDDDGFAALGDRDAFEHDFVLPVLNDD